MTAQPFDPVDAFPADPARVLESYADATRIVAPSALVRRFQASVAQERIADRGLGRVSRAVRARAGLGGRSGWPRPAHREGARLVLRLQGLVLLLLLTLALGALAGGAGARLISTLEGPRRGSDLPAHVVPLPRLAAPSPSMHPAHGPAQASPAPTPVPTPSVRTRALAQQAPGRDDKDAGRRHRRAARRHARGDAVLRRSVVVTPVCPIGMGDDDTVTRAHPGRGPCAF